MKKTLLFQRRGHQSSINDWKKHPKIYCQITKKFKDASYYYWLLAIEHLKLIEINDSNNSVSTQQDTKKPNLTLPQKIDLASYYEYSLKAKICKTIVHYYEVSSFTRVSNLDLLYQTIKKVS